MTTPSMNKFGSGGGGLAPTPAAQPQMTDQELRLECAKLAVAAHPVANQIVSLCNEIYNFVKSGSSA